MARLISCVGLCVLLAAPLPASGQTTAAGAGAAADFVAAAPLEPFPEPLAGAVAGITAEALAAHVDFLASPCLQGRGLGDRGLDAALEYAAATFALAGVAAPEPGGRFQEVVIRELDELSGGLVISRSGDGVRRCREFRAGVDCILPAAPPFTLSARVVFAGHGIRELQLGHDDTAGLDAQGKILLVVAGLPPGPRWQTEALRQRYDAADPDDRYEARAELARELGAVAVLVVEADDWPARLAEAAADGPSFLPFAAAEPGDLPPVVPVSPAVAEELLGDAGATLGDLHQERPRELPGVEASLELHASEHLVASRNVLGVIPGSDPQLGNEVVLLGAHADHLGRVGEEVFPGADDNASGVAALLEIARALAAVEPRPKRTVAFAVWTGEEEGKLGSGAYVRHPAWPLATTTYLNLDMIGHPWLPEEIARLVTASGLPDADAFTAGFAPADFVEPGVSPDRPALDEALRRAARGTGLALHFDHTDGTHGGSDYRDFARAGVPFIRFFGNYFPAYHEPGDRAAELDPRQVQRVARLALATAWLLADR